ncbi:MAG: isoprenylcysteine carboxylmethyltransferase family protein [Armatimonadetes bacterium]|nr:isoprenylcysteine carboxylmethyltransferase family protein [Armatimonadota bacterium]
MTSTCATHQALARLGRAIYPARGAFGVPLMVAVLLLCRVTPYTEPWLESARCVAGWGLLVMGLFFRVWGVACWFTRDASGVIGGRRLMTDDGPYAYMRNPRYFGNLAMGLGCATLAGMGWVIVVYGIIWCAVHFPIMEAERETLSTRFGEVYDKYCARVPIFWPRVSRPLNEQVSGLNWSAAVHEETGTLMGWICLGLFVEAWRVAQLSGAWLGGWRFLVLIPLTVLLCEAVRARVKGQEFKNEDRPNAP